VTTAGFLTGDAKAHLSMVYEIGTAFVGFEAAVAFRDFVEKYERQVTIDDILAGKLEKIKDWSINDHTAMADKIIASGLFKKDLPDTTLDAVAKYALAMPSEVCMKFWKTVSSENVKNTVKLHDRLSDRIVQILNPNAKTPKK
jgi:hypothetical protein